MPSKYQNIFGWFSFDKLYKQAVDEHDNSYTAIFVELGSFQGKSAIFMAEYIQETNKDIQFFCVDLWPEKEFASDPKYYGNGCFQGDEKTIILNSEESIFHTFIKNTINTKTIQNINMIRSLTWDAANIFDDNSVDFIFIDAGHHYETVCKDILSWYPKLKSGKIIAGHDFGCGVKKAVLELLPEAKCYEHDVVSWFFRKPFDNL